jgi:hypothetical protein
MNTKINEFQNKLQQSGWKGQGKEKDHVKDGETSLNRMGKKYGQGMARDSGECGGRFLCRTKSKK